METGSKFGKKMKRAGAVGVFSLLLPVSSQAFCLQDCRTENTAQRGMIRPSAPSVNYQQNQSDRRVGSHNFGEASTNVMGDMNIHVGHEQVEIKGMENSTNSMIDTSINSTIILGNMKQ